MPAVPPTLQQLFSLTRRMSLSSTVSGVPGARSPLIVNVVSDVMWPWCLILDRNLKAASRDTGVPVEINWLPYQLNANTAPEGEDLMEHLVRKYGPQALATYGKPGNPLDVAGRKVGVVFNPARRVISTMKCHQLMTYCKEVSPDRASGLMDILFRRYFEEAQDVSKVDVLVEAAVECGLSAEGARETVTGDKYKAEVLKEIQHSQGVRRISGVPHVSIQSPKAGVRAISFSGAQPAAVIAEQLLQVLEDADQ